VNFIARAARTRAGRRGNASPIAESFTLVSAASPRQKYGRKAIVLAITFVGSSLSAARAEDPDQDFVQHWPTAGDHWETGTRHHAVPFSEAQRPNYAN
jgi:hypothetical protein